MTVIIFYSHLHPNREGIKIIVESVVHTIETDDYRENGFNTSWALICILFVAAVLLFFFYKEGSRLRIFRWRSEEQSVTVLDISIVLKLRFFLCLCFCIVWNAFSPITPVCETSLTKCDTKGKLSWSASDVPDLAWFEAK